MRLVRWMESTLRASFLEITRVDRFWDSRASRFTPCKNNTHSRKRKKERQKERMEKITSQHWLVWNEMGHYPEHKHRKISKPSFGSFSKDLRRMIWQDWGANRMGNWGQYPDQTVIDRAIMVCIRLMMAFVVDDAFQVFSFALIKPSPINFQGAWSNTALAINGRQFD